MLYLDMPYHLPEDVLFKEILPKLPVRSLCRFKCVSKSWSARISGDPTFVTDHLDHHSNTTGETNIIVRSRISDGTKLTHSKIFLLEDHHSEPVENFDVSYIIEAQKGSKGGDNFKIIGCCNGLVCLRIIFHDAARLVMWNPATREFRYLPKPTVQNSTPRALVLYEAGIDMGFDEHGNDYKIVRFVEVITQGDENFLIVQLFSKSSGSWRQIKVIAGYEVRVWSLGLQIHGALLWPFLPYHEPAPATGGFCRILSFDLRSEEIRKMKGPVWTSTDDFYYNLLLIKWKGSLGALTSTRQTECEFWLRIRNDKSDNNFCWTKMFKIRNLSVPFWSLRSRIGGKFIFYKDYDTRGVFLYDPFTKKLTEFDEDVGRVFDGFDYFQSLVSPH